jgi:DNA processing protein
MNRFVALNLIEEIGTIQLKRLLDYFASPEGIFSASREKLQATSSITDKAAQRIISFDNKRLDKELALTKKLGLKILTIDDKDYPENLKNIPDPAIVLYVKGALREEDKYSVGIVGSRRASFYGLQNSQRLARELAGLGITIVSGMARGIDTYAHRGALRAQGRTIAVMGSGFNQVYPPENKDLTEAIAGHGAVISEFPIQGAPLKQNFPRRNRLISGLSLGVLVVEAAKNSGALITADCALEQGREVFALPGKVDSANSFGTNALIKQGAKLVVDSQDILEELNIARFLRPHEQEDRLEALVPWSDLPQEPRILSPAVKATERTLFVAEEEQVYSLISREAVTMDELAEKTCMEIPRISDILLNLQLRKLIQQLPGKLFIRSSDED